MGLTPREANSDAPVVAQASTAVADGRWLTVANAITCTRFPLAPLCAWAILNRAATLAFVCFAVAVASDLLDGRVARRRGEVSRLGGLLDHTSDALFVAAGLAALAVLGVVPWLLAPLVVLAFAQYALDSKVLAGMRLRTSRLGRLNGIAYFVVLGTPLVRDLLGWRWPSAELVSLLGGLLVASTLLSMGDRALTWLLSRRAPGLPGGER
jgi:phosphatidylglycerophosphate synthase